MAITLDTLRKSRNQDYSKLMDEINASQSKKTYTEDNRFWRPQRDKTGNGSALIRFLSIPGSDDLPYITEWNHSFKGPTGKYYIQKSLTTIGLPDPVYEANGALYALNTEESKKLAGARKRSLSYISNVLVINDTANPDNNGKVFLYRYGKKIFDKIIAKQNPTFEDEKPLYVWDVFDGANFKMKVKTIKENDREWPNYDDSEWATPSPISGGDEEKILEVVNSMYDLNEFKDPSKFKTYDELKAIFDSVVGNSDGGHKEDLPEPKERREEASATPKADPVKESAAPASTASAFDAFDDDIPF